MQFVAKQVFSNYMVNEIDIFSRSDYQINKGFRRQVKVPLNYLVKVIGVDCEPRTCKHKRTGGCEGQIILAPNEKFSKWVFTFFLIKRVRRRVRRTELKRRKYEEVEATI